MADRSEHLSIIVTAQDLAAGKLSKVRAELAQMGRGGQIAAVGLGTGIKAVRTMEGAARHLGGVIGSLAGPVGLIGLTGAVFGLTAAVSNSISKSVIFGEAVDKVRAITGDTAEATSALVDTLDYYNVKAEDQARIIGMAEKNLGTLTATTKAAAKFQAAYGLSLVDPTGRTKAFNELLIESADYFNNKSIPAQTKAAALAKIYGRNWQELVPILTQGSAKLRAAEADAIKLSSADLANMTEFKDASREWNDTLGDLEVTIGAKLLPSLTDLARTASSFVRGHSGDITRVFMDGLHGAQQFAGFISGSVIPTVQSLAGTAKSFWDGIPAPLRDIIVKGFIADRTVHFLFGLSPGKLVLSLAGDIVAPIASRLLGGLGGILGGFAQRGSSPLNPVFVAGGAGVGGGGAVPTGLGLASKVFLVGEAIGLALIVNEIRNGIADGNTKHAAAIEDQTTKWLAALPNKDALVSGLAAVDKGINDIQANPLNVLIQGEALDKLRAMRTDIAAQLAKFNDRGGVGNTPYGPWVQPGLNGRGGMGTTPYGPTTQAGINAQGGVGSKPYGPYISALDRNTLALTKTADELNGIYSKAAKARGIDWKPGDAPSTTLTPRIRFMGQNRSGSDLAAEADALAAHVLTSNRPLYTSAKNQERILKALEGSQRRLLDRGDVKNAAKIGADITALKTKMATSQAATTKAIQAKDLSLVLTNVVNTVVKLSSRELANKVAVDTIRTYGSGLGPGQP